MTFFSIFSSGFALLTFGLFRSFILPVLYRLPIVHGVLRFVPSFFL